MNKTAELLKLVYENRNDKKIIQAIFTQMRYRNDHSRRTLYYLRDAKIVDTIKHTVNDSFKLITILSFLEVVNDRKNYNHFCFGVQQLIKEIDFYHSLEINAISLKWRQMVDKMQRRDEEK